MKCQRCGKESDMGHGDTSPCEPSVSKPWEQEWYVYENAGESFSVGLRGVVKRGFRHEPVGQRMTREAATLSAAAPDMARALLAIRERVAQAGDALPRPRNADEMAALEDSCVTIPTEMLRAAFAALRKAGAL